MNLPNRRKFFSFKHLKIHKNEHRAKLSPERIHYLFKEVDNYYNKLSPSNCSKNILAINSNIDTEIENAKSLGTSPSILTSRSQQNSLSPSKNRIRLPHLNISPNIDAKSFTEFGNYPMSLVDYGSVKESQQSGRLTRINKIIYNCSGLKEKVISARRNLVPEKSFSLYQKMSNALEPRDIDKVIVERCKKHFEGLDDEEDIIKTTHVMKTGKKLWRQNHLAFMKTIDRQVNSIKTSKHNY